MWQAKITVLSNRIQRYAAEQVREATDERNAYINALIDKLKAEVRELRQERDALTLAALKSSQEEGKL